MISTSWRVKVTETLPRLFWIEYILAPGIWKPFLRQGGIKFFNCEKEAREVFLKILSFEANNCYPLQRRLPPPSNTN